MITLGFGELTPDVSEAADRDNLKVRVAFAEGLVSSQAIALEVSGEGVLFVLTDEDGVQASVGPAGVPIVEDAVFGMMVGPEVAFLGFAASGLKVVDGRFIDFEVVAQAEPLGVLLVEATKESGEMIVPRAHEVAGENDAVGGF